jgi:flagellar basal body-associated protein FliL
MAMRIWLILMSMAVAGAANGKASEMIYAQELVNRTVANHPDIVVIAMHVAAQSGENTIIASNIGGIGKKADAEDLKVIKTGVPKLAVNKAGDRFEVELVLKDANSRNIGALGIVFPYTADADRTTLKSRAEAIRDDLARHISHRANLLEPAQYDTAIPTQTYGQSLVDEALLKHSKVVILALHVQPDKSANNVIIASNIGRIGKKADEDDLHVIATGEDKLELNETGDRYEVEQTLKDNSGATIGAVGVVFAYVKGQDTAPLQSEAKAVRDELAARIPSAAALFAHR